ncbi:MAG TPA: 50S ribosomal protein L11 methyltransferase [Solirubrobacteraceae bacterium]|nr:50S ribosomal protein L11 methyltransferase [Solirubrobacteraceae bacterium]
MIRLAVRVRREQAELVLAELLGLAPSGVEERDLPGGVVEYAVYGAPGEVPELPDVRAAAGGALVEVVTERVADDWHERWKAFHRPVDAGVLHLRAPWHDPPPRGRVEVVIDPGQAFGTGAHDTTRLCLELLAGLAPAGACVDVGCGSGVLAIAAAKLGWSPVLGVDHDPEAVRATRANAAANAVVVEARRHDVRDAPAPGAPLVLANLLRPLLLRVAADGFAGEQPRLVIASGLLPSEAGAVASAFAARGLRERARRVTAEWCALLLQRAG